MYSFDVLGSYARVPGVLNFAAEPVAVGATREHPEVEVVSDANMSRARTIDVACGGGANKARDGACPGVQSHNLCSAGGNVDNVAGCVDANSVDAVEKGASPNARIEGVGHRTQARGRSAASKEIHITLHRQAGKRLGL